MTKELKQNKKRRDKPGASWLSGGPFYAPILDVAANLPCFVIREHNGIRFPIPLHVVSGFPMKLAQGVGGCFAAPRSKVGTLVREDAERLLRRPPALFAVFPDGRHFRGGPGFSALATYYSRCFFNIHLNLLQIGVIVEVGYKITEPFRFVKKKMKNILKFFMSIISTTYKKGW